MNRIIDYADVETNPDYGGRVVNASWHDAGSAAHGRVTIAIDTAPHDPLRACAETFLAAGEPVDGPVWDTFCEAIKLAVDGVWVQL
jgi:hypothetical protein